MIITRLWSKDVFVDVETGVNTAVRKIRRALNDSLESAAFIETVTGKGYRFIAQVDVMPAAPATPDIMLAVLPFVLLSGEEDREYLADGLTEETIASLSQLDPEHFSVIGHRSAMSYKATTKTLATIGSELKVHFVVDGSIRIEGSWCRVRCSLSRVRDQVQLWSHSYDREASDLLGLQRDLSRAIAGHVRLQLSPNRLDSVARRHSGDATAHDLYLRGRRYWNQLTPATTRMAIDYYTRATEIDPNYALAWAGLAEAFASAPINGDGEPHVMWPLAHEAAEHAIRANAALADAHHVHGQVTWFFKWDFPGAVTFFRQAVSLDPSNAWAHSMLGHTLSQMGCHEEAAFPMERACQLEPLSPLHHAMASQVAFQARDSRTATAHARRAIAIDPEFWVGHVMLGQACEQIGETDQALDALGRAARLSGGNSKPMSVRGYVLARGRQGAAARDLLNALEDAARSTYVPPYAMALICAGLADADAMVAWLERAYAVHDVHLVFLPVDPKWECCSYPPRLPGRRERERSPGTVGVRRRLGRAAYLNGRRQDLYDLSLYLVLLYEAPHVVRRKTELRRLWQAPREALREWLSMEQTFLECSALVGPALPPPRGWSGSGRLPTRTNPAPQRMESARCARALSAARSTSLAPVLRNMLEGTADRVVHTEAVLGRRLRRAASRSSTSSRSDANPSDPLVDGTSQRR